MPAPPGAGEDLVGPPAEQERVGTLEGLADERRGLVVEQRRGPSEALESSAAVLVGRAGFAPGPCINPSMSLRYSVEGDVRDGREFHGRSILRAGVVVRYDRKGLDGLELIRFLQVAQTISVHHGALAYLLGINALRATEAAAVRIEDGV
jgi:hypothetical protein